MGVHFASFIFASGRSPPLIGDGVRCRDTSIRARRPPHLQTETGARSRHRSSPDQARATDTGSVLQLTAVRPLRIAGPAPAEGSTPLRDGGTASSSFRSPAIPTSACPSGRTAWFRSFLATLAIQQKSQTIRFRTAAEMLESFGMHTGGKEYRRLVGAFERIFGATIFFGTDSFSGQGNDGPAEPIQLHARSANLVQPGSS